VVVEIQLVLNIERLIGCFVLFKSYFETWGFTFSIDTIRNIYSKNMGWYYRIYLISLFNFRLVRYYDYVEHYVIKTCKNYHCDPQYYNYNNVWLFSSSSYCCNFENFNLYFLTLIWSANGIIICYWEYTNTKANLIYLFLYYSIISYINGLNVSVLNR
jgi:hypothetical protein